MLLKYVVTVVILCCCLQTVVFGNGYKQGGKVQKCSKSWCQNLGNPTSGSVTYTNQQTTEHYEEPATNLNETTCGNIGFWLVDRCYVMFDSAIMTYTSRQMFCSNAATSLFLFASGQLATFPNHVDYYFDIFLYFDIFQMDDYIAVGLRSQGTYQSFFWEANDGFTKIPYNISSEFSFPYSYDKGCTLDNTSCWDYTQAFFGYISRCKRILYNDRWYRSAYNFCEFYGVSESPLNSNLQKKTAPLSCSSYLSNDTCWFNNGLYFENKCYIAQRCVPQPWEIGMWYCGANSWMFGPNTYSKLASVNDNLLAALQTYAPMLTDTYWIGLRSVCPNEFTNVYWHSYDETSYNYQVQEAFQWSGNGQIPPVSCSQKIDRCFAMDWTNKSNQNTWLLSNCYNFFYNLCEFSCEPPNVMNPSCGKDYSCTTTVDATTSTVSIPKTISSSVTPWLSSQVNAKSPTTSIKASTSLSAISLLLSSLTAYNISSIMTTLPQVEISTLTVSMPSLPVILKTSTPPAEKSTSILSVSSLLLTETLTASSITSTVLQETISSLAIATSDKEVEETLSTITTILPVQIVTTTVAAVVSYSDPATTTIVTNLNGTETVPSTVDISSGVFIYPSSSGPLSTTFLSEYTSTEAVEQEINVSSSTKQNAPWSKLTTKSFANSTSPIMKKGIPSLSFTRSSAKILSTSIATPIFTSKINCNQTHWSPWSPCSATCDYGIRTRNRIRFLSNGACKNLVERFVCEIPKCLPMTEVEEAVSDVLHTTGCAWLLGILIITILILGIFRIWDIERAIHVGEEGTLFLAHIFIATLISAQSTTKVTLYPYLGLLQRYGCNLIDLVCLHFDAFHVYCLLSNVIDSGGFMNIKQIFGIGLVFPLLPTFATVFAAYSHYRSEFSCWINFGHNIYLGTFLPIGMTVIVSVVLLEAAGQYTCVKSVTNKDQVISARINQRALLFILPLTIAAWFIGQFSTYFQVFSLNIVIFGVNIALGLAILVFHFFGHHEARDIAMKCLKKCSRK